MMTIIAIDGGSVFFIEAEPQCTRTCTTHAVQLQSDSPILF